MLGDSRLGGGGAEIERCLAKIDGTAKRVRHEDGEDGLMLTPNLQDTVGRMRYYIGSG